MKIIVDDLSGPEIAEMLEQHIRDMRSVSPPESKHALDLEGLRKPEVTFWTIWDGKELAGCGALKDLNFRLGEIKSMRTSPRFQRRGIGSMMLSHIVDEAKRRNYERLSLETGSMKYFEPARNLYAKFGFVECSPFANYEHDPNSVFLTKALQRKKSVWLDMQAWRFRYGLRYAVHLNLQNRAAHAGRRALRHISP